MISRLSTVMQGRGMAKLIYASNMSLDGCTEDERGAVDWAPPDDDVFAFITKLMRSAGTYLYGRRMYETMAVWETDSTLAARSSLTARCAKVWQAADKVVYSSSLASPSTANTRLERHFDPSAVHDLKAAPSRDLLLDRPGGRDLASEREVLFTELPWRQWIARRSLTGHCGQLGVRDVRTRAVPSTLIMGSTRGRFGRHCRRDRGPWPGGRHRECR